MLIKVKTFSNFHDGTGRSRGRLGNDSAAGHVDIELEGVQNLLALVAVGIVVVGPVAEVLWWRVVCSRSKTNVYLIELI